MEEINTTTTLKNKKILIFQQRGWGKNIGRFLARKLFDAGCIMAAITSKYSTHKLIVAQKDVHYEFVISHDEILNDPERFLSGEEIALETICKDLGVTTIWPIVAASRVLVKSYKDKYYYGFKKNVSDEFLVNYIKATYKCVRDIFKKFTPEIILAPNFASGHHIIFYYYAKKNNVPMITVSDTKVNGLCFFSLSFNDDEGLFFEYLDALEKDNIKNPHREKAAGIIRSFREKFQTPNYARKAEQQKTTWQWIKEGLAPLKNIVMWYIKKPTNHIKSIGPSIDYKPPHIILRDYFAFKKNKRDMENFNYHPLEKVEKFVYFPLQFQPEASIDAIAPRFSNQIETARQVAMSLPGDLTLVVKEHPGMIGLRPLSYIEKIAGIPNLKLVDYRNKSEEILKRATMVISPNGTTLYEAAFYAKPAIQLGNLGTTLRLPNVFRHTDTTTLPEKIQEILSINLANEKYERRLENFVSAAIETGFGLNYLEMWERGEKNQMDALWETYEKEIERLLIKK